MRAKYVALSRGTRRDHAKIDMQDAPIYYKRAFDIDMDTFMQKTARTMVL